MTAPAPAVAKVIPERARPVIERTAPEVIAPMSIPTNPALLDFPQDQWGFTSELKKAVLKAASTVNAQPDKQKLLIDTLELLLAHVDARFSTDALNKEARKEQARKAYIERHNRRRYNWVGAVAPDQP